MVRRLFSIEQNARVRIYDSNISSGGRWVEKIDGTKFTHHMVLFYAYGETQIKMINTNFYPCRTSIWVFLDQGRVNLATMKDYNETF